MITLKHFILLLLISTAASSISARDRIICNDNLYVGSTSFIANLNNGKFKITNEIDNNFPNIEIKTISEGTVISDDVLEGRIIRSLVLESDSGEHGSLEISNLPISKNWPRFMKSAKLTVGGRNYGFGLICF